MLTRKQIEEIQAESREKGVTIKSLLEGKGISPSQYFWWKRKFAKPDIQEGFLPVAGDVLPDIPETMSSPGPHRCKSKAEPAVESWMTIEFRAGNGTEMRIQGGLTPAMVCTILKSV